MSMYRNWEGMVDVVWHVAEENLLRYARETITGLILINYKNK